MSRIARPASDEYAPFYAGYVQGVPDGDPLELLMTQFQETSAFLAAIGDDVASRPYAPGKWSVKDVILHMADTERVMAYRALCIARGEGAPLPGFDQDAYVVAGRAGDRPLDRLLGEMAAVRMATVALFQGLPDGAVERRGSANGLPVSARGLLYIVLGHELHHRTILERLHGTSNASATAR